MHTNNVEPKGGCLQDVDQSPMQSCRSLQPLSLMCQWRSLRRRLDVNVIQCTETLSCMIQTTLIYDLPRT